MTMDISLDRPRTHWRAGSASNHGASYLAASGQVATRTIKKFVRTPALIVAGTAQGVLFLLIFRYVFGGAVAHTGGLSYVDFLVPGFVVTGVLFQGMSASSGVAEDLAGRAVRPAAQPAHPPALHRDGPGRRRFRPGGLGRAGHDRRRLCRWLPHQRLDR